MQSSFRALSLSYKTAPVSIREQAALNESETKELLFQIKEMVEVTDLFILSTCNRTEIYYQSTEDFSHTILNLLAFKKSIDDIATFRTYFEFIDDAEEAAKHLCRVSIGLESQVTGDMQIINQVKHAYQWGADMHAIGPFMHRLLHTIFFANKRVTTETAFRDGAASVSYAAVELIEELAVQVVHPKVLVLGLGEIGADVCRNLKGSTKLEHISICNRTLAKAEELAAETGFAIVPFENLAAAIQDADVIVSSIAAPHPIITPASLDNNGEWRFKLLIDLSVPRSIDPACEKVPGALLLNVDVINNKATEAQQARLASIPQVESILEEAIFEFADWSKEMMVTPVINQVKTALEQIRQEEIARYIKNLDEQQSELVDKITKSMMQKVLKMHVLPLKAACKRGEAEEMIGLLQDLFTLEKQIVQ
jgi:glutamyl-tRNA reductase